MIIALGLKIRESSIIGLMAKVEIASKAELARRCNMKPQSLSSYVKNKRRASAGMIERFCEVLDAQPGDFIYYEADDA
jgi:DNA-binding Xre family transcriptional regulator